VSCRALGVSQSWFYRWKDGRLPPRAARRQRLKAETARLFAARGGKEGSPRVTAALREAGWRVSENTVAALMREQGLGARRPKRRKGTTRPGKGRWRAEDLVRRKFAAGGINRRWYGDGTEIKTAEGKLYRSSAAGGRPWLRLRDSVRGYAVQVRDFPSYRRQRHFPGLWWLATTVPSAATNSTKNRAQAPGSRFNAATVIAPPRFSDPDRPEPTIVRHEP
jgi:hypothetical protein